ncbi:DNA-3-methyladenine glycosylase family protein [Spirillospora sp. NPDC048911]|uniref:DNA-3-methyladenine glycosylase family protein n=1 Tax=Spirillospora sp. NPDC048911 TaxID=3364527 RepID=UPI0037219C24
MNAGDAATVRVRGRYDLNQTLDFLEGWPPTARTPQAADGLRFTYCVPGEWTPTSVHVTQSGDRLRVAASQPVTPALAGDVARILSADVDGSPLAAIAERDDIAADLVSRAPGRRPVCFWSTWEAACWAVLVQRTSMRSASAVKERITREFGGEVSWDGHRATAFPAPEVVAAADSLPGVPDVKFSRIQSLAHAALDGTLDAVALRDMPTDQALALLQELPGVGPFSAGLILIRGAGAPDAFPGSEPRLFAAMRGLYRLPESAEPADYARIADDWRPLRSWISFLVRSLPGQPHRAWDASAAGGRR